MPARKLRGWLIPVLLFTVVFGLGGGAAFLTPRPAAAASPCAPLTRNVHNWVQSKKNVTVLTFNQARAAGLRKAGYVDRGVLFKAASKTKGLTAVRVMYRAKTGDRIYTTSKKEIASLKKKGYRDNGTGFHAYTKPGSCLVPAYRFNKGSLHRYAVTAADQAALRSSGWTREKAAFYVAKAPVAAPNPSPTPSPTPPPTTPAGSKFTIGVIGDTQNETMPATDRRFANRTQWLADNAKNLNLRFVTHTGDIVSWDTDDHIQYKRAAAALSILNRNNVAYSLSPGSHDTAAVCPGGSACPGANTKATVRNTTSFNTYLNGGVGALAGRYDPGKLDNTFSTFSAGGLKWLVLNLELWPRVEVVNWAKQVVASRPDYNVIVATHSYLTSAGAIYTRSDYGATSPQYLYNNLISRYPNVRIVLAGHAGKALHRVDQGVNKNRIDTFVLTMHDNVTNPVRLIEIDTAGSLRSWIYAPYTNLNYPSYSVTVGKVDWAG